MLKLDTVKAEEKEKKGKSPKWLQIQQSPHICPYCSGQLLAQIDLISQQRNKTKGVWGHLSLWCTHIVWEIRGAQSLYFKSFNTSLLIQANKRYNKVPSTGIQPCLASPYRQDNIQDIQAETSLSDWPVYVIDIFNSSFTVSFIHFPYVSHLCSWYNIKLHSLSISNTAQVLLRIVLLDGSLRRIKRTEIFNILWCQL